MALEPVKRSWRNVAAAPPPPPKPVVVLHVEPPPPSRYSPFEDFLMNCVSEQAPDTSADWQRFRVELDRGSIAPYMVNIFETQSLLEMQNKTSYGYLKLHSDLQWIANEIKCNVVVYLGHIEQCSDYIQQSKKRLFKYLEAHPTYPNTIFLLIGCWGGQDAYAYNTDPQFKDFQDRNIAFFGFRDLMHFHMGEIYSCKEFSHMTPNIFCDYDGLEENISALLKNKDPYNNSNFRSLDKSNPLYKCCSAKFENIFYLFLEDIYKRGSAKYTKEKLKEKFLPYALSNGDRSLLTAEYVSIIPEDGILCRDRKKCPIPNPFIKQQATLKQFEERELLRNLYGELTSLLEPDQYGTTYETKIEEFWKRIQDLQGREREIFNYRYKSWDPFLFWLLSRTDIDKGQYSLNKIATFIFDKYHSSIDLNMRDERDNSILDAILLSQRFKLNDEYNIFKSIYSYLPSQEAREALFLRLDAPGKCPLCNTEYTNRNYTLLKFYIEAFGPKLKDIVFHTTSFSRGNILHWVMMDYKESDDQRARGEQLKCVKALLLNGVDPNQKVTVDLDRKKQVAKELGMNEANIGRLSDPPSVKPLELYATLFYPPYNKQLLYMFYTYGMTNENSFIQEQHKRWSAFLPFKEQTIYSFQRVMNALKENVGLLVDDPGFYTPMRGGMPRYRDNYYNYYGNNYSDRYSNNNDRYSNGYYDPKFYYNQLDTHEKDMFELLKNMYIDFLGFHSSLGYKLQKNFDEFIRALSIFRSTPRQGKKIFTVPLKTYTECLRIRKAYGKHGSKFKRTRKQNKLNLNKTLRNNLNALDFEINPEKQINEILSTIMEVVKKPQFTREEKTYFKKQAIEKKQSTTLNDKTKRDELRRILEQMKTALAGR